jgi:hypothetical protein
LAAQLLEPERAVALETSRRWRIAKEKQSHKIDVVSSLGDVDLVGQMGPSSAFVSSSTSLNPNKYGTKM